MQNCQIIISTHGYVFIKRETKNLNKWRSLIIVVQLLSHVHLFVTPLTAAHQASLSFTISWRLLKLLSIELVMSSNHLIPYHPLLLLPSIFLSIQVVSKSFPPESILPIR